MNFGYRSCESLLAPLWESDRFTWAALMGTAKLRQFSSQCCRRCRKLVYPFIHECGYAHAVSLTPSLRGPNLAQNLRGRASNFTAPDTAPPSSSFIRKQLKGQQAELLEPRCGTHSKNIPMSRGIIGIARGHRCNPGGTITLFLNALFHHTYIFT